MIINLINDDTDKYKGKKLIASGNDSLSFVEIENLLRQTYTTADQPVVHRNKFLIKLFKHWNIFFHGNTHITNFDFMLDFMQSKSPQFNDYESAASLLDYKPKSFREYCIQKAEKFDDRISSILEEEPEDYRFPALQNYYKVSLD